MYILSAWFQLKVWNAPGQLDSARNFQLDLAQLRKFQLELITMYIYVMVRTVWIEINLNAF